MDGGKFDDRTKSLTEVDIGVLSEVTKDPTSFVPIESTINQELVLEDLFASDDVGVGRPRKKGPCVILDKCQVFLVHRHMPVSIIKGAMVCRGY